MKVAKCLRLLSKDSKGLFKKDGANEVKRARAIIEESVIKASEGNYKETGVLWVINTKLTKERNENLKKK